MNLSSSAPSDHVNASHHMAFDVCGALTFHISSEQPLIQVGYYSPWMVLLQNFLLWSPSMTKMVTTAV